MIALKVTLVTLLLTGIVYPFFMTQLAKVILPTKSQGSLVLNEHNQVLGSELLGQNFTKKIYFWPRPSDAGKGYDGMASQGSNLAPTSAVLMQRVRERVIHLKPEDNSTIPGDLVMTSASGLDPHISPEAAYWQAPRVAIERKISLQHLIQVIQNHIESPQLYFMGQRRINVLRLNMTLDRYFGSGTIP